MENAYVLQTTERKFGELYLCYCGYAACEPLHSFGPAVRPNYIIHYILTGKGTYYMDGNEYTIHAGQGFLIEPDTQTFYAADNKDPWKYLWIGFDGSHAKEYLYDLGLSHSQPVFSCTQSEKIKAIVLAMLKHNRLGIHNEFKLQSLLFDFFATLACGSTALQIAKKSDKSNLYVKKAVEYIKNNYATPIKIGDVARYTAVNRSYLYTLFEDVLGISPQEYLVNFRLTRAAELLSFTDLPVEGVAHSCGYNDPLVFSKAFKNKTGKTPSKYRQAHLENMEKNKGAPDRL